MPHKYNTRIKSGALVPFLYIRGDDDNNTNDDDNDDDYKPGRDLKSYITIDDDDNDDDDDDTSSSSSKDNNTTSEFSDSDNSEKNISNKKNNVKKINKCDYYKFLSELYPSTYSKNKYIDEIKKTIANKRHKKSDSTFVISPCNSNNLFSNKVIKKSRKISKKKVNNYNYLDDENNTNNSDDDKDSNDDEDSNDDDDTKYEKSLLTHGFKKMFDTVNSSDKNINIILNLKKGKNNIYNNEATNSDQMLSNSLFPKMYYGKNKYHNGEYEEYEEDEEDEEHDDDDDDENKSKSKKNKNVKKKNITMSNENEDEDTIVPAPQKISNKNYKKFEKILNNEEKESEYFKKCLSKNVQLETIAKLEKLKELTTISKPYLLHLVDLDIPDQYKACALKKINTMRSMGSY